MTEEKNTQTTIPPPSVVSPKIKRISFENKSDIIYTQEDITDYRKLYNIKDKVSTYSIFKRIITDNYLIDYCINFMILHLKRFQKLTERTHHDDIVRPIFIIKASLYEIRHVNNMIDLYGYTKKNNNDIKYHTDVIIGTYSNIINNASLSVFVCDFLENFKQTFGYLLRTQPPL